MAIQMLPDLRRSVEGALNRTLLWDELVERFFDGLDSGDTLHCRSIRDYYRWCVDPQREALPNSVQTSAVLGFLERFAHESHWKHIPSLPQWLTFREVADYSWNIQYAGGDAAMSAIKIAYGKS